MAPISKENEVLTAAPKTAAAVAVVSGARSEETATASKPQPVALEVPVTVNGARTVEGSDKREPFSEATRTVLVFGNGAVIRLGSPVAAGQLLFLTNEKTKKEVVCQVVKSKNYRNVSGYVELEFTESVVGFWGMRFPSDRIGAHAPAPSVAIPPPARNIPVAPISVASKVVSPAVSASPRIHEIKPAQIHTELKVAAPAAAKPEAASMQATAVPAPPVTKKPEMPVIPASPMPASLASSLASLLSVSEVQPVLAPSRPLAPPASPENKPALASAAAENSSEELKLQAERLQEQLSSLLFSAAATAEPVPPVPALDSKALSGVADKVFEIAKSDPIAVKAAPPAKTFPPPVKSSLDTEEVKIPSWLEPLARNAAAPASTPELVEREKSKHAAESATHEENFAEPAAAAEAESASEIQLPGIGSLLPFDEEVISFESTSRRSRKGLWIGAIAATLLAAGGAWYQFNPSNTLRGASAPVSPTHGIQTNAASTQHVDTQPAEHPASRNEVVQPEPTTGPIAAPRSSTPASSEALTKSPSVSQSVSVTRENTRGTATTIPAAITERISRPAPVPEPKKPALGEVHLASPTMNRPEAAQDDQAVAPTISTGNANASSEGFASGLAAGNGRQPAVPEVPLLVGGDVKSAKLISQVSPMYPLMAKNQHVTGDVIIDALIDANGRVTTMKVISGPTLLHQAARDALRQWKYRPASLDGKPVAMHLTVTLQFRMQ
ncbi:MAG: energy transducer TonB [Candidatus Acidiferrales bacterium]|mgnify:CR=1 FL=1